MLGAIDEWRSKVDILLYCLYNNEQLMELDHQHREECLQFQAEKELVCQQVVAG